LIRRTIAISLWVGGGLLAVACAPSSPSAHPAIVETVRWTTNETLHYDLVAQGGDVDGRCILTTELDAEPGATRLSHLCADIDELHRDDRIATVDAATLAPRSSSRVIADLEDNRRTTFTTAYDEQGVRLSANQDGDLNETTREIPEATDDVPDPAWYDDETLFWIVRSVPLHEGFEGRYTNVNAANGRVFDVKVEVDGTERITVPAGEFDCWTVRIETDSVVQRFWIEREAPHRVIRARIERINYVLTSGE